VSSGSGPERIDGPADRLAGAIVVLLTLGCRERAQAVAGRSRVEGHGAPDDAVVAQAGRTSVQARAAVLRRSRVQVRDYVIHKFDETCRRPISPPAIGASAVHLILIRSTSGLRYRLADRANRGLLRPRFECVVHPADIEPFQLRIVVSHELVHALQDQYVRLDSIITQTARETTALRGEAILEGQATVAQIPS